MDDLAAELAELRSRGLKTVDGIADLGFALMDHANRVAAFASVKESTVG